MTPTAVDAWTATLTRRTRQDCTGWLRSSRDSLPDLMRLSDDAAERGTDAIQTATQGAAT